MKLSYAARKVEGVKLGEIIERDLTKKLLSSEASHAPLRDPHLELSTLDRPLGDGGFEAVLRGLTLVLQCSLTEIQLDELCVQNSALTNSSLPAIAAVVHLAKDYIQDIDLSKNSIKISTPEDLREWTNFLASIQSCIALRRLDLSGNPIGLLGFEALARQYAGEDFLDETILSEVLPSLHSLTLQSNGLDQVEGDPEPEQLVRGIPPEVAETPATPRRRRRKNTESSTHEPSPRVAVSRSRRSRRSSTPASAPRSIARSVSVGVGDHQFEENKSDSHFGRIKGLRALPFLVLSDTGLDDAGALFIAEVVQNHHVPDVLLSFVPAVKAGGPRDLLKSYSTQHGCLGIVYSPNEQLSAEGLKLLKMSEQSRTHLLSGTNEADQEVRPRPEYSAPTAGASHPRPSVRGRGRRSLTSLSRSTELGATRSRLQGMVLKENGHRSILLWTTALRNLVIARCLLFPVAGKSGTKTHNCPASYHSPERRGARETSTDYRLGPITRSSLHQTVALNESSGCAAPPPKSRSPDTTALSDITNKSPQKQTWKSLPTVSAVKLAKDHHNHPQRPFHRERRKESFADVLRPDLVQNSYRDARRLGSLSVELWTRILVVACNSNINLVGQVLNEGQWKRLAKWAAERETLTQERANRGKAESIEIWKVLEGIGCLGYNAEE